jgi:hypothetical protein
MRRSLLLRWLGTGLLGPAVALGCGHAERNCPSCGGHARAATLTSPYAGQVVAASSARPAADEAVLSPYHVLPTRSMVHRAAPAAVEVLPMPQVSVVMAAKPKPTDKVMSDTTADKRDKDGKTDNPGWQVFASAEDEDHGVRRRTFTDITANPAFAHAPDYSWLIGTLELGREPNTWGLRYASVEEEDRYGGCVSLVEQSAMTDARPGQLVRVEGMMVDPGAHDFKPAYRVHSLRPMDHP